MGATQTTERRYLVTGALGAIGAWTMRTLRDRGYGVVGLDVGSNRHRLEIALDGETPAIVAADITDLDAVERVLAEHAITNVIHLAALQIPFVRDTPAVGAAVNVLGTVNVLEAVRRAGVHAHVVYASSIAALTPDGAAAPQTLYGIFKRTNEDTAVRYFEDYGVSSIGLRPHTVYGPGRDQGLTSAPTVAMLAAAAGVPYEIPFGGRLQFQYLPDVAEAFVRASELDHRGAAVHTLDGPDASVEEVVELIGSAAITWRGDALPFPGAVDGTSFVELLGGSVNRPLADGVAESIAHFRDLLERGAVQPPPA